MEWRSREPHLILRHLEYFAIHRTAKLTGVVVKGCHNFVLLNTQSGKTILLGGAGKISALRHHQAARLGSGHTKLLGDDGDGTVWGLTPDDHLRKLSVDGVDQALLVGPTTITESLIVSRPRPGEDLGDGFLIDGLHGPAHPKAPLDLKGGVVVAAFIHHAGNGIHIIQLVGEKHLRLLLELEL